MEKKIIGRFYFKQTTNGNLIGEFSNNHSTGISTESCELRERKGDYLGDYESTWQENGKPILAQLTISPKPNGLFILEWRKGPMCIFKGEGMLCDDILIGDYHSVEK